MTPENAHLLLLDCMTSSPVREGRRVAPLSHLKRVHLVLVDFGRSERTEQVSVVKPRRLKLGLYDVAVLMLLIASLAAISVCLAQIG